MSAYRLAHHRSAGAFDDGGEFPESGRSRAVPLSAALRALSASLRAVIDEADGGDDCWRTSTGSPYCG